MKRQQRKRHTKRRSKRGGVDTPAPPIINSLMNITSNELNERLKGKTSKKLLEILNHIMLQITIQEEVLEKDGRYFKERSLSLTEALKKGRLPTVKEPSKQKLKESMDRAAQAAIKIQDLTQLNKDIMPIYNAKKDEEKKLQQEAAYRESESARRHDKRFPPTDSLRQENTDKLINKEYSNSDSAAAADKAAADKAKRKTDEEAAADEEPSYDPYNVTGSEFGGRKRKAKKSKKKRKRSYKTLKKRK